MRVELAKDPDVHRLSAKIASRLVWAMQTVLRPGERERALATFYAAVREELEKGEPA